MDLISIIIPTLNEEDSIRRVLSDLALQKNLRPQIIIADGGSTDRTKEIVAGAGHEVVLSKSGRGRQLNAGATQAKYEFLLFLHADSRLECENQISGALAKLKTEETNAYAGHFGITFHDLEEPKSWSYCYMEEKSLLNRVNTTNGDQGLLLRKDYFERLGGYDESLHFLEDQELVERIRRVGNIITLPGQISTSARRFKAQGLQRTKILMSIIMGLFSTGAIQQFLKHAPKTYETHDQSNSLLLTPYFRSIRKMLVEEFGIWGSIIIWYKVGCYIRQNSWQLFFALDSWLRYKFKTNISVFTRFHDRVFWPLTNWRIFDCINTVICFFWFMGVLPVTFYLIERNSHGDKGVTP